MIPTVHEVVEALNAYADQNAAIWAPRDGMTAEIRALASRLAGCVVVPRECLRHLLECASPYPGSLNEAATRTADELLAANGGGK